MPSEPTGEKLNQTTFKRSACFVSRRSVFLSEVCQKDVVSAIESRGGNQQVWQAKENMSSLFYTELTTGLRRGEICGLQWEDFDEADGTLKIVRSVSSRKAGALEIGETKTNKGRRTISLPDSTAQRLRERKKAAISQWIFPNPLHPEEPVNPSYAYHRLKTILKNTGLPSIRFHDLRHTFATHALAGGVDAKTLSGILGHTNSSFTLDTYTHVTGDMQKQAANIVGDFMADILGQEWKLWQESERTAREP